MKTAKDFVKWDLYWVAIVNGSDGRTADHVDPNKFVAKVALVNNKTHRAYIISENIVLPLTPHHYVGTANNYYTDEPEHYDYQGYARPTSFQNFDATAYAEKFTDPLKEKMISFENILNIEKYQHKYIEQLNIKEQLEEERIAKANIEYAKKRKIEQKQEHQARSGYPKEFQD